MDRDEELAGNLIDVFTERELLERKFVGIKKLIAWFLRQARREGALARDMEWIKAIASGLGPQLPVMFQVWPENMPMLLRKFAEKCELSMRERAAKVVEAFDWKHEPESNGAHSVVEECGPAIRALSPDGPETPK